MANILVVDDDQDILRMMEFTLKRAGHEPVVTTSGFKGLEIVKENPPQLVIVDIMMPKMTGYEFTRQVRNQTDLSDLPIIIYSARAQSVDRQAALEAGATDYMPKTVSPQEIIEKINSILGGAEAAAGRQSRVMAYFSLRGGAGVTTVAVNQAVILAVTQKTRILLADFNPLAGHAGLQLGLKPTHFLPDLFGATTDLTADTMQHYLTDHASGVQLLASPTSLTHNKQVAKIDSLLKVAKSTYRFTLLDLPHQSMDMPQETFGHIDKVMLLLAPEPSSLQSAIAGLNYLRSLGLADDKIALILNHNMAQPSFKREEIEQALSMPIAASIPFDEEANNATKAGKPLVLFKQKSPTAAALARLTAKII